MTGRKNGPKVNVLGEKPEPPPFIARMREQMVANENADRRERSEKRRREIDDKSGGRNEGDDPVVVNVNRDLTEEEFKRMKLELDTQYRLDETKPRTSHVVELDIDALIQSRKSGDTDAKQDVSDKSSNRSRHGNKELKQDSESHRGSSASKLSPSSSRMDSKKQTDSRNNKTLAYGSSSDEDED